MMDIESVKKEFESEISAVKSLKDIKEIEIKYLGKKGMVSSLMKGIKDVPKEEKPLFGKKVNELKTFIKNRIEEYKKEFEGKDSIGEIDYTLSGYPVKRGHLHPLTIVLNEIVSIFQRMGFSVSSGPEIETQFYNFEALNTPPHHPARDMHDTFYLDEGLDVPRLLRTHTSPVQIRTMEKTKPPVRIIAPGAAYRVDTPDATHSPYFHQVEGLYVDKGVTFADLKGTLTLFAREIFSDHNVDVKFIPQYFPFTEPSAEMYISCIFCGGKGCNVCKGSGYLEIMGSGMVHPNVLRAVGYDPDIYSGYAFGMGLERITMLKYRINDMKLLFDNDMRFLEQFYEY